MIRLLRKLFTDPTADWPRSVHDPVLGELRLSEDATWWEGKVTLNGKEVEFNIGGEGKPDERLIAHTYEFVANMTEFEAMLADFLEREIRDERHLNLYADEIRQLELKGIHQLWPNNPHYAEIIFKGPDEYKIWGCGYADRKLFNLGFDD
ncbi:MAG: DUF2262 domain-containing protein [Armatimonadetes bacterium]|nr:DUF2262 domain-containing protein [Armatimonadota bacterium]